MSKLVDRTGFLGIILISITLIVNLNAGDWKINGDVQYRMRLDLKDRKGNLDKDNDPIGDYSNRYWWNLRVKKDVTDNLKFGMRFSNPKGYFTDGVDQNVAFNNGPGLSVPEFYFNYSEQKWSFSAGIIPVYSNVVLNMVAAEEFWGYQKGGLSHIGIFPWAVGKNNSQIGMKGSYTIQDNETTSIGLEAVTSTVKNNFVEGPDTSTKYTKALTNDTYRFILSAPIKLKQKDLAITPIYHLKTGPESQNLDDVSFSSTLGIDAGYSAYDWIKPKLGLAYGSYSSYKGYYLRAKVSIKPGFGKIRSSLSYGLSQDDNSQNNRNNSLAYIDVRYVIPVKDFSIAPRLRIWDRYNDQNSDGLLHVRPEILFSARF